MAARKRIDPSVRPADGRTSYDRVGNKDANRHYVLTNPNDPESGTDFYLSALGYELETKRAGGPTVAGSHRLTDGATLSQGGMVLVSCPMEEFTARYEEGQAQASLLERRILKEDGLQDGLRGRGWEMRVDRDRDYRPGEEA